MKQIDEMTTNRDDRERGEVSQEKVEWGGWEGKCGPKMQKANQLVNKSKLSFFFFLDADGNGAIDFPEFLALMSKNLDDCDPEDILKESFKVFDRDGSGFIGVSELDRVFKLLGQDFKDYEIEAMIKAADVDGDGLVGYDDFMKMMNV